MTIKISVGRVKHFVVVILWVVLLRCETKTAASLDQSAGGGGANGVNRKCVDHERDALLDFKAGVKDFFGQLTSWRAQDDCCKWARIKCNNQTRHVVKLDLHSLRLEGDLRPSLLNLNYLNYLDLSGNGFSYKPIPTFVGSLTELRYLNFSWTNFNGSIPEFIGSSKKLRYLDLLSNNFNGNIPMFVGSLTELRYLDLSDNNFNGTIPMFIGSLTILRYLDLSSNNFNGTIPMSVGSLTELRHLDLSDTESNLDGAIRLELRNLTNLRHLALTGSFFHGSIPSILGNLTNLRHLELRQLRGVENLDWLDHLSLLQDLHMTEVPLTKANHWVDTIVRLPKLSSLSLVDCDLSQVRSPFYSLVNSSSSIATLDLSNNSLTSCDFRWLLPLTSNSLLELDLSSNLLDGIPKYLGNLCSLTSLYTYYNYVDVNFPDFLQNLSGCAALTLQHLDLVSSQFTGPLPDGIQKFLSLKSLKVPNNKLNGTLSKKVWELSALKLLDASSNSIRGVIPESFGKSKLQNVDVSNNSLEGVLSKVHMSNLSHLKQLDLSSNSLTFELSSHWVPSFQLHYLNLRSCKLGPDFPRWIHTQKHLRHLDISNSSISDTIPVGFWDLCFCRMRYLNLSSNNISGKVPDLSSNFEFYPVIDLSSNNFYGRIPLFPSGVLALNLSRNKFYGGITFLCQMFGDFLISLDLSHNSLFGPLPNCLSPFSLLKVLNVAHNNLSGRIPTSVGSLFYLQVLYLNNNRFSGDLPLQLKNCTDLAFLDLGENMFSGNVPAWIGENLSQLYALSLGSNNFFGPIPSQLCRLTTLQILNLSMNKIFGTIPRCLNNLTSMVHKGSSPGLTLHAYGFKTSGLSHGCTKEAEGDAELMASVIFAEKYADYAMIIRWQGNVQEFTSNLRYLKSIDLSSNNLTGQIPEELTGLYELLALNLSKNALHGQIPRKIGQMKKLLALDLSENNLVGGIPSSMRGMSLLNYLNLSNNHLSGRVPSGTQLQSFEASSYTGNAGLCGPPLTKSCPGDEAQEVPAVVPEDKGSDDELDRWFYFGGATGFATGFSITCSAMLLSRCWSHALFRFLESLNDWIYVRVALFSAKLQRAARR